MSMNQKEAVFAAITNTIGYVPDGSTQVHLTDAQSATVNEILFEGFKQGNIAYDGALPEESKLKSYVSGLKSNWLRKDKRLNGGVQYTPKNPGSRSGSADPAVKSMRALLNTMTDPAERAEVQGFIDARLAELKPASAKVEVNIEALPEALRKFVK